MTIARAVKKYEKYILITIVVLMAASLVVWIPAMPSAGQSRDVGTFRIEEGEGKVRNIIVTDSRFAEHKSRAFFHLYLRFMLPMVNEKYNMGQFPILSSELLLYLIQKTLYGMPNRYKGTLIFTKEAKKSWDRLQELPENKFYLEVFKGESNIHEKAFEMEELREYTAWENIVLLEHARETGIECSKDEFNQAIRGIVVTWYKPNPYGQRGAGPFYSRENYLKLLTEFFGRDVASNPVEFETAVKEYIVMNKLLNRFTDAVFPSMKEVYESQNVAEHKRIVYTIVEPSSVSHLLKPITETQVTDMYIRSKSLFKTKERTQLYYVAITYEDNLTFVEKPTDSDAKEYYDSHNDEFKKGNKLQEFDTVKEGIVKKLWLAKLRKERKFQELVFEFIRDVKESIESSERAKAFADVRSRFLKADDVERKLMQVEFDTAFEGFYGSFEKAVSSIIPKYEAKGLKLRRDVTISFTKSEVSALNEKVFGSGSALESFCFGSHLKGDLFNYEAGAGGLPYERTDRGFFMYLIIDKKPAQELPLNNQIREIITDELRMAQFRDLMRKQSNQLVEDLKSQDLRSIQSANPQLKFFWTDYFSGYNLNLPVSVGDRVRGLMDKLAKIGDTGLVDASFGRYTFYVVAKLVDIVSRPKQTAEDVIAANRKILIQKKRILEKTRVRDSIIEISSLKKLVKES